MGGLARGPFGTNSHACAQIDGSGAISVSKMSSLDVGSGVLKCSVSGAKGGEEWEVSPEVHLTRITTRGPRSMVSGATSVSEMIQKEHI